LLGVLKLLNLLLALKLLCLTLLGYRIVDFTRFFLNLLECRQLFLIRVAELELVEEAGGAGAKRFAIYRF